MLQKHHSRFRPALTAEAAKESKLNRDTREFFSDSVNPASLIKGKSPHASLKLHHRKVFELSLVTTLVVLISGFQIAKHLEIASVTPEKVDIKIEVADIPLTQQFRRPPPPARPVVPIPTEDEAVPEDLTIASTEINLSDIPPPPPPPEDDDELPIFVAYDEPPEMIGGLASLQKHLKYPRLAQAAGVEGVVFVKVLVGLDGKTERAEVIQAKPASMGFEESAMEAIKKAKWIPAKQRDKSIRVWVSIPVQFKLVS